MKRFTNQPLRSKPHIAVFAASKVGNFVVITPLLRGLKEKYPDCTLDFFGSDLTQDFEVLCPYIDWRFSLYSDRQDLLEAFTTEICQRRVSAGSYDLAINCDEFSEINLVMVTATRPRYIAGAALIPNIGQKLDTAKDPVQALLKDKDWNSEEFLDRYRHFLNSNYISEIFCRVCYVETDYFKLEVPIIPYRLPVPNVLIHVTATRPAKQWPVAYWLEVIRWCQTQGKTVGLMGHRPELQRELYHSELLEDILLAQTDLIDLRGQTSLPQLAGVLSQADLCVTLDTGPLHIAAAVGCPTVAIFGNSQSGEGASPIRLWAPRLPHVAVTTSTFSCSLCQDQQFKNRDCLIEAHPCMTAVTPQQVIAKMKGFNTAKVNSQRMDRSVRDPVYPVISTMAS